MPSFLLVPFALALGPVVGGPSPQPAVASVGDSAVAAAGD